MKDTWGVTIADDMFGKCPLCERKLKPIPIYRVATTIVKRTCRSKACGASWSIKVKPILAKPGVLVHTLEFTEVITSEQHRRHSLERSTS